MGKYVTWGKKSWGNMTFGEKRHRYIKLGKKWGKMSFGEKGRREKCYGEKYNLGKNVLHPFCIIQHVLKNSTFDK